MSNLSILNLAKKAYLSESLSRPDWTVDVSRDEDLLWLDKNENIDPVLSEQLNTLLKNLKPFSVNTYPETAKVYKKLAEKNKMSPQNFLLTNGSDGSIRMVFDVFIDPGDKILHTNPTFAMYSVYSKMFGAQQIALDYEMAEGNPRINLDKFFQLIKTEKPKLVCLPNPDSPTGTVLNEKELNELIALTGDMNILLLIDEAYFPFYEKTVLPLVNTYSHLLVCRTFSKAWGAAGVRVGFLAGHPEVMKIIHKNRAMYELSTISTEFVNVLLDHEEWMQATVDRLKAGKLYFEKELNSLGFKTTTTHGNFIHVDFENKRKTIEDALKSIVLFRSTFKGTCLENHSRFSLGTKEQFEETIKVIRRAL